MLFCKWVRHILKIKLLKKITAAFMAMLLMFSVVTVDNVYATEDDWTEVQGILSDITGTYTAPSGDVISTLSPDGPLMGNGDIGVVAGSDGNSQTFYIGKNDFWNSNSSVDNFPITLGRVTVKAENIAQSKTVTANEYYSPDNRIPANTVDGDTNTYWSSNSIANSPGDKWLMVDLGSSRDISRWKITHAAGSATTRDFKLQKSSNGTTWVDVDSVTGNTNQITDLDVVSFNSRYVRIYITQPTQPGVADCDKYARIMELELYANPNNLAFGKTATANEYYSPDNRTPGCAVDGNAETLWSSNSIANSPGGKWLMVDLGSSRDISRWRVTHAGGSATTCDFSLQKSSDGTTWVDVDSVTGNTNQTTDRIVEPFNSRYIRIYITQPTQPGVADIDKYARIFELKLYCDNSETNVIKTATANEYYTSDNRTPGSAVDDNLNTFWSSNSIANSPGDKWLMVDLGSSHQISRWKVIHASGSAATRDFKLQRSTDGINWVDVDSVTGNTEQITDRIVEPFNAKYVRVYITQPTQPGVADTDKYARIVDFKLYCDNSVYRQEQDILHAEVDSQMALDGNIVHMKSWTAESENLLVTEMWTEGSVSIPLTVDVWIPQSTIYPSDAGVSGSTLWAARETKATANSLWVCRNAIATRITGTTCQYTTDGCNKSTASFTLAPDTTVRILSVINGGKDVTNHLTNAQNRVAELTDTIVDGLREEHLDWWKDYWLKSFIDVNDQTLEDYYYGALYTLACTSREGEVAPGLYGNWVTTDSPEWKGDYHTNYNIEAPYFGVFSSNRQELSMPYYDFVLDYVEEGKSRARQYLGVDGVYYPVGLGPWGSTAIDLYQGQKSNASYLAVIFIYYYYYTQDTDFLEDTAYPFLKEVGDFWEDYLVKDAQTGKYIVYNSATNEGIEGTNPIIDLAFIKYLFKALLTASSDLNADAGRRANWADIYNNISEYPTTTSGGVTYFANYEGAANLGGLLACYPVWPCDDISLSSDPALLQIARNSLETYFEQLEIRRFTEGFEMAARLGYSGDELVNWMKEKINEELRDNLTIYEIVGGIEGAAGVEAINSMLLQSHEGVLRFFPAWPGEKAAHFKNLRAQGAFLVSAELQSGETENIRIVSEKGKSCTIKNPWPNRTLKVRVLNGADVTVTYIGDKCTFNTSAVVTYEVYAETP